MADIGDRAPDAEANVRGWLAQLDTVDQQIFAIAAGGELRLSEAEDGVKFDRTHGIQTLQNYGRTLINKIAITFFVVPQRDYYDPNTTGNVTPLG